MAGQVDTTNLPDKGPAPALHAKGWINSPPLTPADLKGKVVLYDFWTYSCINCLRTFPYIRAWFDRYTRRRARDHRRPLARVRLREGATRTSRPRSNVTTSRGRSRSTTT